MHPMCPADELAMIRAQLTGLRTREQELRQALLTASDEEREGRWSRADVVTRTMRVFDHRLLPQTLRDDPCYWRERDIVEVRCLPIHANGAAEWDGSPALGPGHGAGPDRGSHRVHM